MRRWPGLRRAGAALVLRTDGDWIADVLRFIVGRKRGWTGATAPAPPTARPAAGGLAVMSFASPWWLAAGLLVLALGVGYLIAQRRRRRNTVKFANLELLDKVAPGRPGWWRHIPALVLVGLMLLTVALAGPTAQAKEPRNRAVVMLAVDTSLSMEATDVAPNRLDAAKEAAQSFVDDLTPGVNLGIVSFAGIATVLVQPDHRPHGGQAGDRRAHPGRAHRHRRGDHLQPADDRAVLQDAAAGRHRHRAPPARIVLMTDGKRTVGRTEQDAAQRAADAGVPVSVIAFGTDNGSITVNDEVIPVPLDTGDAADRADLRR